MIPLPPTSLQWWRCGEYFRPLSRCRDMVSDYLWSSHTRHPLVGGPGGASVLRGRSPDVSPSVRGTVEPSTADVWPRVPTNKRRVSLTGRGYGFGPKPRFRPPLPPHDTPSLAQRVGRGGRVRDTLAVPGVAETRRRRGRDVTSTTHVSDGREC